MRMFVVEFWGNCKRRQTTKKLNCEWTINSSIWTYFLKIVSSSNPSERWTRIKTRKWKQQQQQQQREAKSANENEL
jgi:hypothetical protein